MDALTDEPRRDLSEIAASRCWPMLVAMHEAFSPVIELQSELQSDTRQPGRGAHVLGPIA
jgi:hypothetical protein